jgi:predicted SAM-dependent methyltransferase
MKAAEKVRGWLCRTLLRMRGDRFTSRRAIELYFNTIGRLTRLNYYRYRYLTPPRPPIRVHVGSGPKYIPGFVNIEGLIVWKADIRLDLRAGLPFKDNAADVIYCCHVLEHFDIGRVARLLVEFHRVLRPGGGLRIVVPDLERAVAAYASGAAPDADMKHSRFGEFRSRGAVFNWKTLCDNNHPVMLDYSFLAELLERAGRWDRVARAAAGESAVLTPGQLEAAEGDRRDLVAASLVVEGFKALE